MIVNRETMLDLVRYEKNEDFTKVDEEFLNETRWGNLYRYIYLNNKNGRWYATMVEAPGTSDMDFEAFIEGDYEFREVQKVPKTVYVWGYLERKQYE